MITTFVFAVNGSLLPVRVYYWYFFIICGQVVTLNRQILGDDHPGVADSLSDLAELRRAQGKLEEVRRLKKKKLSCDHSR